MTSFDRYDAIEEIKALKACYFRCMDTKNWVAYGETFARQGVLEVQSTRGDQTKEGDVLISRNEIGPEAIVKWVSEVLRRAITIHQGYMPEIEIISTDKARGIWAMEDRVIWPEKVLHGWGHYHETYTCEDGVWKILHSTLTRLHVEWTVKDVNPDPNLQQMLNAPPT